MLILSDKTEARDVVQDKLESVLSKVRHGDGDFPNPILRLGRSGNTFNRLVSASAREKINTHHQAATRRAASLERETADTMAQLRSDIGKTVGTLTEIRLDDLNELHRLEAEIELARPGFAAKLQKPVAPERIAGLEALAGKLDPVASAAVLSAPMFPRLTSAWTTSGGLRVPSASWPENAACRLETVFCCTGSLSRPGKLLLTYL